jgi:hypothetical protein
MTLWRRASLFHWIRTRTEMARTSTIRVAIFTAKANFLFMNTSMRNQVVSKQMDDFRCNLAFQNAYSSTQVSLGVWLKRQESRDKTEG